VNGQESEPAPKRETGNVEWFDSDKGFGFIRRDSGGEIFVQSSSIRGTDYEVLDEGSRVAYTAIQGEKGLEAKDVVMLDEYPPN